MIRAKATTWGIGACALLIGVGASTARWVRAAPGVQATAAADPLGLNISLQTGKPGFVTGDSDRDHGAWVTQALKRMQAVRTGMTRHDLNTVFERAGGWSGVANPPLPQHLSGVYSYHECPNFKVDVEFAPVRKEEINKSGYRMIPEDSNDVIVKISRPFVDDVYSD